MQKNKLRPYTIVHQSIEDEFKGFDQQNPNCVLIGDATNNFSYNNVDEAFRVLLDNPLLLTMGYGYFVSIIYFFISFLLNYYYHLFFAVEHNKFNEILDTN